jgi:hypothetical protein
MSHQSCHIGRMLQNLDLRWIPPSQYPSLGDSFFNANVSLLTFLNHVVRERWSRVGMAMDGETKEVSDVHPPKFNPKGNATRDGVGATEGGMLP